MISEPYAELATTTGIAIATTIVTNILKVNILPKVSQINIFPTWVYAILVGAVITLFSRYVLGAIEGDIGPLLWEAILLSASASGFYSWYSNVQKKAQELDDSPDQ